MSHKEKKKRKKKYRGFWLFVKLQIVLILLVIGGLAYFFFGVGVIASGQMGRYDVPASVLHEMYIVAFLLMLLAFWRHRANIKRLATGTENKIEFGKK